VQVRHPRGTVSPNRISSSEHGCPDQFKLDQTFSAGLPWMVPHRNELQPELQLSDP
jgi:hypothetical protein